MELSLKPHKYTLAMAVFALVVILSSGFVFCTNPNNNKTPDTSQKNQDTPINRKVEITGRPEEYYPAGSSLPDCSHACGPCFPCKRVMVSFKCSVSESCPIIYRCTCKGKFYHIPSAH